MLITTTNASARVRGALPPARSLTLSESDQSQPPAETFTASSQSQTKPKERYEAWVPLANAGLVALAVGVPSLLGAAGTAAFGSSTGSSLGLFVAGAVGGGTYGYQSSKNDYHPVYRAFSIMVPGGGAALAAPILGAAGSFCGFKGAAVATAVAAVGAGVVSAFGIHFANKSIDEQNAALGIKKPG